MIKLFLIIAVAAAVLFPQVTEEYLEKGHKAYADFNNEKAVEYFELAVKSSPNNYEALINLAKAYNAAGDQAQYDKDKIKAEFYVKKGMDLSEKLVKAYPDSGELYAHLSMSYGLYAEFVGGKERLKMAKKIEDNGLKAIKLKPGFYLPYIVLGIYYRKISSLSWLERAFVNTFFGGVPDGTFEDSRKMLYKALEIDPGMMIALFNLSLTYHELDNEKKEKELLQKVLKMPVRDFRDKYTLARAKARLEKMK